MIRGPRSSCWLSISLIPGESESVGFDVLVVVVAPIPILLYKEGAGLLQPQAVSCSSKANKAPSLLCHLVTDPSMDVAVERPPPVKEENKPETMEVCTHIPLSCLLDAC